MFKFKKVMGYTNILLLLPDSAHRKASESGKIVKKKFLSLTSVSRYLTEIYYLNF